MIQAITASPETAAGIEQGNDFLAKGALKVADALCDIRPTQARAVASEITTNSDYYSWKLAGTVAVIASLDKVDGMLARWASNRLGIPTTPEGAEKDQLNDKKWTHTMLGALAARAFMNGEKTYGSFVLANQAMIKRRDQKVTQKRKEAEALGVDAKAQKAGKAKTFMQNLTLTAMTSPLAKNKWSRKALVYPMQLASTGLSVYSGRKLIKSLDRGIAAAKS